MKCKICEEKFDTIYKVPRNLTCGHTFCEQCLKIYTKGEEIYCPKCMKVSQANNLPICYAIFEILEHDMDNVKNDFCLVHTFERNGFLCKDCNKHICQVCYINEHKEHRVNSIKELFFVDETKKDFYKNFEAMKEKCDYLHLIKNEIEKCEDFIEKMNEKQLKKLYNIQDSMKSNKKENLEHYDKLIELNYLTQKEILNKLLNKIEYKQQFIDIYCTQIQEILANASKNNFKIKENI